MYDQKAVKYYEQGRSLHQASKLVAAERAYKKAIKISPDFVEAYNNLGNVLVDLKKLREASQAYQKALNKLPNHPMLLNNLGNVYQLLGQNNKAIRWLEKAINEDPKYADAYSNLGNAFRDLGEYEKALGAYRNAIKSNSSSSEICTNLALTLMELDRYEEVESLLERAIKIDPLNSEAHNGMADFHLYCGRLEEAIALYQKVLELDSRHSGANMGLATAFREMGDWDSAIKYLQQAISLKPEFVEAYLGLSHLKSFEEGDKTLFAMERMVRDSRMSSNKQVFLQFALGEAYLDLQDYDRAFDHFHRGNQFRWESHAYDVSSEVNYFDDLCSAFSPIVNEHPVVEADLDTTPIFIVGLPRSGKSLCEKLLSHQESVYAAGERSYLYKTISEIGDPRHPEDLLERTLALSVEDRVGLACRYLNQVTQFSEGELFVTDTMPSNFCYIGFIKLLFPNARVIHCLRQPMDVCWFIYQKCFGKNKHLYSYDLESLGLYYQGYARLLAHWHTLFPGYIYDLAYEQVVRSSTNELSSLFSFVGIKQDGQQLEQYENSPLHDKDIDYWRHFESHLKGLQVLVNRK